MISADKRIWFFLMVAMAHCERLSTSEHSHARQDTALAASLPGLTPAPDTMNTAHHALMQNFNRRPYEFMSTQNQPTAGFPNNQGPTGTLQQHFPAASSPVFPLHPILQSDVLQYPWPQQNELGVWQTMGNIWNGCPPTLNARTLCVCVSLLAFLHELILKSGKLNPVMDRGSCLGCSTSSSTSPSPHLSHASALPLPDPSHGCFLFYRSMRYANMGSVFTFSLTPG